MSMERHRCKLCSRIFSNGRALGGHMRSHLATLPLPPKKKKEQQVQVQLGDESTESDSSSTQSAELEHDEGGSNNSKEKGAGGYVLRENPKRSLKASEPEFLDAGSVVVQDRESETESTQNPTRRRSKRPSHRVFGGSHSQSQSQSQTTQLVHENVEPNKKLKPLVKSESVTESTPVSSVSDASQDEEVALCLMMLSRDVWVRRNDININIHKVRSQQQQDEQEDKSVEDTNDSATELKLTRAKKAMKKAAKFKCLGCKKVFRTNRALSGHKASNKECQQQEITMNFDQYDHHHQNQILEDHKIYECPFCYKVFGSGQALGGHKRAHLLASSTNPNNNNNNNIISSNIASSNVGVDDHKGGDTTSTSFVLDLNLPAPVEDDHDSQLGFI